MTARQPLSSQLNLRQRSHLQTHKTTLRSKAFSSYSLSDLLPLNILPPQILPPHNPHPTPPHIPLQHRLIHPRKLTSPHPRLRTPHPICPLAPVLHQFVDGRIIVHPIRQINLVEAYVGVFEFAGGDGGEREEGALTNSSYAAGAERWKEGISDKICAWKR